MDSDSKKIFSIFDQKNKKLPNSPTMKNNDKVEKNISVTFLSEESKSLISDSLKVTSKNVLDSAPLSEKMRPCKLKDYIGQTHLIGTDTVLYSLLKNEVIPNMILWGPPGCGKV